MQGLDERVGKDDVQLPLERLEDDHLLMHELLHADRMVVHDRELREGRQLAVEKLGRDEQTRGGNHLHLSLADGSLAQRDVDVTVEVIARDAARLHLQSEIIGKLCTNERARESSRERGDWKRR